MAAVLSETGSSFISAVDWDILSKFGMEVDFSLLVQVSLIEIAQNVVGKTANINVKPSVL